MGCCIPRKKCITFVTANKKSTHTKTTKYEKLNESIYLNKSLACLELQKYYLPIPIENLRENPSINKNIYSPIQSQITKKDKNKIKIKQTMNKLKNLSLKEVYNCQKYFISNKNNIKLN